MIVLVDYNNITEVTRRRGVVFVIDRIVSVLDPARLRQYRRVGIRLYDGWYEQQSLTPYAQKIAADVQAAFPGTTQLVDGKGQFSLLVNVELAYSLRCDPGVHMWHTYRPRRGMANLSCRSPQAVGCFSPNCVLAPLPAFFSASKCPSSGCTITPEDMLTRHEQKLVDSMLSTDLFFLHLNAHAEVAVVSSDDDLWPAIKLILSRGMTVYHIHTHSTRRTPSFYTRSIGAAYVETNL